MHVICNIEFVIICIWRRRKKFENLCPIPLTKYSIKYVQTKSNEKQIDVSLNFVSRKNEIKNFHITFQDLVNTVRSSSLKYKHRISMTANFTEKIHNNDHIPNKDVFIILGNPYGLVYRPIFLTLEKTAYNQCSSNWPRLSDFFYFQCNYKTYWIIQIQNIL